MESGLPRKAAEHAVAFDKANPPPPAEVWACNWRAVMLFAALACRSCWVFAPGGPARLDGDEVERMAKRRGIKLTNGVWRKLEIMEAEALKIMAEKREADRGR